MAINKVVYGNNTLIDLTEDSVLANNLLEGETAHDKSGNPVTGTAKQGHIVQNSSGTDMTQRSKLQFVGVYTEDDNTNNRTKVNVVREMTKEQMDALSSDEKKGFIRTTNEPDVPYQRTNASDVDYDNTQSGLNAKKVQGAIDELVTKNITWTAPITFTKTTLYNMIGVTVKYNESIGLYQLQFTVWAGNITIAPGTVEKLGTLSSNKLDGYSCLVYGNQNGYGFIRVKGSDVYFHCITSGYSEWFVGNNSYLV